MKVQSHRSKTAIAAWLQEKLGLTQHPEKTRVTHWDTRLRFLGYDLRGQRNPNGTRWLRLTIPPGKERELKAKVKRLCGYTQIPELDLFTSVKALLRGWTQYFRYAHNASARFWYLTGVAYWLMAHYLGRKHRCSLKRVMRKAYGVDPATGKRVYLWNNPPSWQSLFRARVEAKDVQPLPIASWMTGHSYEQRVEAHARAEYRCEHCGAQTSSLLVHHPNRLDTRRRRKLGPAKMIASGQEQHVKVLCLDCHQHHHPGGWGGQPQRP